MLSKYAFHIFYDTYVERVMPFLYKQKENISAMMSQPVSNLVPSCSSSQLRLHCPYIAALQLYNSTVTVSHETALVVARNTPELVRVGPAKK